MFKSRVQAWVFIAIGAALLLGSFIPLTINPIMTSDGRDSVCGSILAPFDFGYAFNDNEEAVSFFYDKFCAGPFALYWAIFGVLIALGLAALVLGIIGLGKNKPAPKPVAVASRDSQAPSASLSAELARLSTLRDNGTITEEEFATAKQNVINGG